MDEILNQIIEDILNNGYLTNTNLQNLSVVKNEQGDVVVTYKNPANNVDVKMIKKYLDELDDEMMNAASERLKKDSPAEYNLLGRQLNNPTDVVALKKAFASFKECVAKVAQEKISEYTDKINELYNTYLNNDEG